MFFILKPNRRMNFSGINHPQRQTIFGGGEGKKNNP